VMRFLPLSRRFRMCRSRVVWPRNARSTGARPRKCGGLNIHRTIAPGGTGRSSTRPVLRRGFRHAMRLSGNAPTPPRHFTRRKQRPRRLSATSSQVALCSSAARAAVARSRLPRSFPGPPGLDAHVRHEAGSAAAGIGFNRGLGASGARPSDDRVRHLVDSDAGERNGDIALVGSGAGTAAAGFRLRPEGGAGFGPGDTLAIDEPRKPAYGGRFMLF
jgi:hypothetical protein